MASDLISGYSLARIKASYFGLHTDACALHGITPTIFYCRHDCDPFVGGDGRISGIRTLNPKPYSNFCLGSSIQIWPRVSWHRMDDLYLVRLWLQCL